MKHAGVYIDFGLTRTQARLHLQKHLIVDSAVWFYRRISFYIANP